MGLVAAAVLVRRRRSLIGSLRAIAPAATAAAAAATTAVALRLVSCSDAGFAGLFGEIVRRQLAVFVGSSFAGGRLAGGIGCLFMMIGLRVSATAIASASPPAAAPTSVIFRRLAGSFRRCRFDVGFGLGVGLITFQRGGIFELVVLLKRGHGGLALLGDRSGCLRRVDLLTPIDRKSLRRSDRRISGDGDGNGEPLLQRPQMRALLVEHVESNIRARPRDQIVRRAFHHLLLERAQNLQRQR